MFFNRDWKSGYKLIEIVGIDRKVQQAAHTTCWATEASLRSSFEEKTLEKKIGKKVLSYLE